MFTSAGSAAVSERGGSLTTQKRKQHSKPLAQIQHRDLSKITRSKNKETVSQEQQIHTHALHTVQTLLQRDAAPTSQPYTNTAPTLKRNDNASPSMPAYAPLIFVLASSHAPANKSQCVQYMSANTRTRPTWRLKPGVSCFARQPQNHPRAGANGSAFLVCGAV